MWMKSFILAFFSPSWWAIVPQVPLRINCWTLGAVTESQVTTIFFPHAALTIFYILSQKSLLSNAYVLLGSWKEWSSVNTHTHTHHSKQTKKASEWAYDRSWKLLFTYLQATITTGKYSEYVLLQNSNSSQEWRSRLKSWDLWDSQTTDSSSMTLRSRAVHEIFLRGL